MSHRVYLPTTLAELAGHAAAGLVPAGTERFLAPDDTEEGEYAALVEAATASAALPGAARRVVLVAEVTDADAAVPMRDVVAIHVDSREDADPDDDLAWFATQELPQLLDGSAF